MSLLWYKKPASVWEEAMPLGNGRLGAMVFGDTQAERIQVNEESVWYGGKQERLNPDAKETLPKVRKLLEEGRIQEAQDLMGKAMAGCPVGMRQYQTLGNIRMTYTGTGEVTDYERSLNLDEAIAKITYRIKETVYTRELFVSKPADAMVMRITAKGPDKLSFQVQMERGIYFDAVGREGRDALSLCGNLGAGGSFFSMMLRAKAADGEVKALGETLIVDGASEVYLYFTADTTWHYDEEQYGDKPYEFLKKCLSDRMDRVMNIPYEQLKQEHIEDYRSLYGRVELEIGREENELPTDERLKRVADGIMDVGLHKMLFDFGRYLLISCSRQGGLPANLQGIWNQDMEPAWDSKYTININTEMNYWPAEVCNLSECHEPLFDLLKRVRESGRVTAREMYGCRGFTAHHNTDMFGDTAPQDLWLPATFWTQGAAWLCTHLWTHYLYTKDKDFLKEAFGLLAESALFYVDFLVEYKGYLVTNPSVSPENTYILPSGERGCCCIGPTMDNQLIRDLFDMCIKSYRILAAEGENLSVEGVNDTQAFIRTLEEKKKRLAPTRIGSDGRIMEWLEEYEEEEPGHRHISHLYGLYPSEQITVDGTPLLAEAARKTLEARLKSGGGHTGWSRAWIMNHYAKLWDGEKACENIQKMLEYSTYPNFFDKHPPFQIDGNFGACAAIAQMLVQSNEERVVLLPALPKAWESGSVRGLRLVGNAEIDLAWENGKLTAGTIRAFSDFESTICYRGKIQKIFVKAGENMAICV